MRCNRCGLEEQREFPAEIALHFPRLADIDKPSILVFPKLSICPHCGTAEFVVPEAELSTLVNRDGGAAT